MIFAGSFRSEVNDLTRDQLKRIDEGNLGIILYPFDGFKERLGTENFLSDPP